MQIDKALQKCCKAAGWSPARLAAEAGVTETSARSWLAGEAEPRVEFFRILREKLPGFAKLVDGAA